MRWSWWVVVWLASWSETRVHRRGFSLLVPRAQRAPPLRVYKGREDTHGIYPYVVALHNDRHNFRMCTGTLITANWVLTAAHCVSEHVAAIQYGNTTKQDSMLIPKSRTLKMVRHSRYSLFSDGGLFFVYNDIALIKVEPAHMRAYGNISAVDYRTLIGHAVQYAGYGTTYNAKTKNRLQVFLHDRTRRLQVGEGIVVPCSGEHPVDCQFLNVAPKCSNNEQDTLQGDSGCPLFHDGKILGVLNGGIRPISMFTPVSPYLQWIYSVIAEDKYPA